MIAETDMAGYRYEGAEISTSHAHLLLTLRSARPDASC